MENCCVVVRTPEADPVADAGTLWSTPETMSGITSPLPTPMSASTGESSSAVADRPETPMTTARPATPASAAAAPTEMMAVP
jgi:hypothetical protein